MSERRPAVCYAAPGHTLVGSAGSARNILAVADALGEWADVTVVFRSIAEPAASRRFKTEAFDSDVSPDGIRDASPDRARDDVAARGLNVLGHRAYLRSLRSFASTSNAYDLVLEKGWRLSGYLGRAFCERGVPAVLIENDARRWSEPIRSPRAAARYLLHSAAQSVAARCSRRLPLVIAETEELKEALVAERRIRPERIEVVGLGVDHGLFRPMLQSDARRTLGLDPDALIMLYVGGMDQYHDLSPLLEALARVRRARLELHLVGDGGDRGKYEELARELSQPVRFYGRVEHTRVPLFIGAADVCLAPYHSRGFHGGRVSFSTLKIPEYMACERPVISVPSGHILNLIEDGVTGFLLANEADEWREFLEKLPTTERLAGMGRAAAPRVAGLSWQATAKRYLDLCAPLLRK